MITLQKKDQYFKILNLSDTQLSNEEWSKDAANILTDTVKYLVKETKPDLITVSGDLAWAGEFVSYTNLAQLLDSFDIPWAPVFGNHDNQGGEEKLSKVVEIFKNSKNCIFECGDPQYGCGNYVIGIEENGKLIHGIIMMDSHDRKNLVKENGETEEHWGELYSEQFGWYANEVDNLSRLGAKESSIIMHIPIYTYREAIAAALKKDIDHSKIPCGKGEQTDCWNEGYEDSVGVLYEGICSYPVDNGFFDLILEKGNTKTLLCGHDHVNNICVTYKGVRFIYSMKTGMGCYWNEKINGGTLLSVDANGKMTEEHYYFPIVK